MQIHWHGPNGRGKANKDKSHSIFTIGIQSALPAQPADKRFGIEAKPAQEGREMRLLPGINDAVAETDWNRVKDHPTVKHYLKTGDLEVVQAETLAQFDATAAKAMIESTIDLNLLRKWQVSEKRQEVMKALDDHLALMTKRDPPPKK